MRYTNEAVIAMDVARKALDRAYSEELCMRVDPTIRRQLMREVETTIRSLDQVRRLIDAGVATIDF